MSSKNKNEQTIEMTAGDTDLTFVVNRDSYNKYINSITPQNKVAPSHNFLMSTVSADSHSALKKFLEETPGGEVQVAGFVLEQYTPDLNLVVKKSSSAPKG